MAGPAAAPAIAGEGATPVPPQWRQGQLYDLRGATGGPRGFKAKRKRDMDELEEQVRRGCPPLCSSCSGPRRRAACRRRRPRQAP